jgi:hypothetical protein
MNRACNSAEFIRRCSVARRLISGQNEHIAISDKVYCLSSLRAIGAEIERSDLELGVLHANYLVNVPLVHASRLSLSILIAPQNEQHCELTIEMFGLVNQLDRSRPLHKPRTVAQQVLSRIGDAVRQHRD